MPRAKTEEEKNRNARRQAQLANAERERVEKRYHEGKATLEDLRAAQNDAWYWNTVVNNINGYI